MQINVNKRHLEKEGTCLRWHVILRAWRIRSFDVEIDVFETNCQTEVGYFDVIRFVKDENVVS